MADAGVNLLDLLDELRDLPPAEQERRLSTVAPPEREKLKQWLAVAKKPADPFAAVAGALAGADPELISKLRDNLEKLQNGAGQRDSDRRHSTTISVVRGAIP